MEPEVYVNCKYIAESVAKNVATYDKRHLTWASYKHYMQEKKQIKFYPFDFAGTASEVISGCLMRRGKKIKIFYNDQMLKERQHFTCMHEIAHYFLHMDNQHEQNFTDLIDIGAYPDEDIYLEKEADLLASLFMMHDEGIFYALKEKIPFAKVCREYEISSAALHNRLLTYFIYEMHMQPEQAYQAVVKYRYQNISFFMTF